VGLGTGPLGHVLSPDPQFWSDRAVLVTGHTGFKGSWLCLWLQKLGARVSGFSIGIPTTPSLFELASVGHGMESIQGDIRDYAGVREAVERCQPEIVLHLAAESLVRRSYADPVATYHTNVLGTAHVLEAVRQVGCAKVAVAITSDKCYDNQEWIWGYRESDPKGGRDPYSSSKAGAELVIDAYRQSYFNGPSGSSVAVASARGGNVVGGGDWAEDRLIPDVMRAAFEGRGVQIRHPDAVRPWQHVLDCLGGYLLLSESVWNDPGRSGGWNFGPADSDARSVRWVLDRIEALWDGGIHWEATGDDDLHEAHVLRLDCSKARLELGWHPRWDVEQAVQYVVDWYRRYREGGDVRECALDQITAFESAKPSSGA